ncbi:MAG TPA: polysaccharide deacetylase family protein, partial [Gemmatimonadaceae bacterium]|nr:polysaccharide deacetylase family protein [Gemmatimonadaceae bacterium]
MIAGARKAVRILDEFAFSATFYLVTGWVRPRQVAWVRDRWNKGCDHGHWRDWRAIQSRGHDVGSHTVTHLNAGGKWARWFPALLRWELSRSHADLRRRLGVAPVSISMPWNTLTETLEPLVARFYAACRLGSQTPRANDLACMNWHRLHSWAPDSDISADEIIDQVRATPPGHWLILQFHSFDGEGYMPVTSRKFRDILRGTAATSDLEHVTVSEMVGRLRSGSTSPRRAKSGRRAKARICLLTSEHLSMNPRLVKEADALSAAGYDVRVVSCQWMDWQQREDARLLETRHWRNQTIDFSPRRAPRLFWYSRVRHYGARRFVAPALRIDGVIQRAIGRVVPEMVRLAASESADLFVGHNIAALPAAVLAARVRGVPTAFDAEDFHSGMWVRENGPSLADSLAERVERRFLPQCAYVTAASPGIAEAYALRYGIPLPATILNVFPMADRPGKFRPHDANAPLTLYWFSQVIGARRGLEEIIRGMALTGSKNIQLHLRGQWQPGYRDKLNQLAREAGLDPTQLVSHDL